MYSIIHILSGIYKHLMRLHDNVYSKYIERVIMQHYICPIIMQTDNKDYFISDNKHFFGKRRQNPVCRGDDQCPALDRLDLNIQERRRLLRGRFFEQQRSPI